MNDHVNAKGWRNRRKVNSAKRDEWQDAGDIRRARQAFYQEQAAADAAVAAQNEVAVASERCRCTACGGTGDLTVERAMEVVQAMHNMMSAGRTVSRLDIVTLAAIAKGEPLPPGSPTISFYGSISPAPEAVPHHVEAIETVKGVKPSKPSKGKPVEDDSAFLQDGALIEI